MRHVAPAWSLPLDGGRFAHLVVTDRKHGDFATAHGRADTPELDLARRRVVDAPWAWVNQVHGADVEIVTSPGGVAGRTADALSTALDNSPVSVQTADCAPVAFVAPSGVVGVAHCGWRGLAAGVVAKTVRSMRNLGASDIVAVLGPCIHPGAYEFGATDLEHLTKMFGSQVAAQTTDGTPALDVPATVRAACAREDVQVVAQLGGCTASHPDRYWSHRARGDTERQAMVMWIEPAGLPGKTGER